MNPLRGTFQGLNYFSLKTVLIGGFTTVIALTLTVGAVSLLSQDRAVRTLNKLLEIDGKIAELGIRSNVAMQKARRAEKDFLLFWREFGFDETRSRYATLIQTNLADLRQHMDTIRGMSQDRSAIEKTLEIERAVVQYETGAMNTIDLYGQLGYVGTGLEGRFRRASHEIESIFRQGSFGELMVTLLTVRRHEKDYLTRGLDRYATGVREAIGQLKAEVAASRLPPALKARARNLADDYLNQFEQYVVVTQRIDADKANYLAAAHTVEPLLESLHAIADRDANSARDRTQAAARNTAWAVAGASLAATLIGWLLALFVVRSITHSVTDCLGFARRVAAGDLSQRLTPKGRNEFTVLAVALNGMTEALQKSYASLEQRAAELAESNRMLEREVEARKLAQQALARRNRFYSVLSETNQAIVRLKNREELFDKICRVAVEYGGLRIAYVGLIDAGTQEVLPVAHWGGTEEFLSGLRIPLAPDAPEKQGPIALAVHMNQPCICNDLLNDPRTISWRERANLIGSRATAAFPLHQKGRIVGILSLHATEVGFFDDEIVDLLTEMATDISFALDTFERERLRAQAEQKLRLRDRAIEASVNAIVITNFGRPDHPIEYVNPAFERITGYAAAEALGRNGAFLQGNDRAQPAIENIRAALRERREGHAVLRNYRKDGSLFWNDLHVAPVPDERGTVTHYVGVLNDVTEATTYAEQLEHRANYDTLTRLPNRNLLRDRIAQAITYAQRRGHLVAIAYVDLDNFKLVNDSLGHSAGDDLLKIVAERLNSCVRESDTVARPSSDEFVLVLPDQSGWESGSRIAQRINESVSSDLPIGDTLQRVLKSLSDPVILEGKELRFTCSIGLSFYPQDGQDTETLLRNADAAMYRAKELGRNNYQFYTAEMNASAAERLTLQAKLRRALEAEEFLLHYQPKVDLRTGRVSGIEALLRWNDKELGLLPPTRFIPVLEQTGMMVEVGHWIMRKALSDYGRARTQEPHFPRIAVNVSSVQLARKDFVARVESVLKEGAGESVGLDLEITESLIMKDIEDSTEKLRAIKQMDVGIAIDDFGTGYSSLAYLSRLPLDALKIDRSFVQDIATNPDSLSIVSTIIDLAHSLKLAVIAEGVETEDQRKLLALLKCDAMQGYIVTPPVSLDRVIELVMQMKQRPDATLR